MSKSSKRDWVSLIIQFVPAILGSGVLITTIGNYYAELGDDPIVRLTVFPDRENYSKASAILSNIGGGPATNLTARITTPYNIVSDDIFSLEKTEVHKIGPKTIQVFMPRLIHGEGSVTNITLRMNNVPNYTENYQTHVVYDQGSDRGHIYEESPMFSALITPVGIMIFGISITVGLLLLRRYIKSQIKKVANAKSDWISKSYDNEFANYYKGSRTIHETANTLLWLTRDAVTFNLTPGTAIYKKYEDYFRSILDDATRQFTTNAQYFKYFEDLKNAVIQLTTFANTRGVSTDAIQLNDEVISNIMTRLDNYLKAKTSP